jgi:hypothetical protein
MDGGRQGRCRQRFLRPGYGASRVKGRAERAANRTYPCSIPPYFGLHLHHNGDLFAPSALFLIISRLRFAE